MNAIFGVLVVATATPEPDPIRVVVESGYPGWWTQWAPLLGVALGAVLGSVGQIVAGRLQRSHEIERQNIAVKRELYGRVLAHILRMMDSLAMRIARGPGPVDIGNKLMAESAELVGLQGEAGVSGSLQVFQELTALLEDIEKGMPEWTSEIGPWQALLNSVGRRRSALMVMMRRELETPDPLPAADSVRTAATS